MDPELVELTIQRFLKKKINVSLTLKKKKQQPCITEDEKLYSMSTHPGGQITTTFFLTM